MTAICEKTGLTRAEWLDALRAAVESDDGEVCPPEVFSNDWHENLRVVRKRIEAASEILAAEEALATMPPEPRAPRVDERIGPDATYADILEVVMSVLYPGTPGRSAERWHQRRTEVERRRTLAYNVLRSTIEWSASAAGHKGNEIAEERKSREARGLAFRQGVAMAKEIESGTIEKRHGENADTPAERRALRAARMKEARDLFKRAGANTQEELDALLAESVARESRLQAESAAASRKYVLDPYSLKLRGLG